ncbi:PQQ-binding-like beta-propeller repeat protein [Planctomicrobium sp. SH661]|uniref:PQQ-binding-like beta-propeller repeat protein n=1 Tax=Planctomicrobium sp. SH661 TaxID=3448124 RepID=UPI003F5C6ABE
MKSFFSNLCCAVAAAGLLATTHSSHAGSDWPYWVGPNGTGVSNEVDLPDRWDPKGGEGSQLLWSTEIGSRSTPTLLNGRLYLLSNSYHDEIKKTGEKVVCLDANTGETKWEYAFNVFLSDVPIERVGWSSVVCDPETGNVYAQGVCGYFCCLNGETGELIWDHSMSEEFGFLTTYGGRTNYPTVFEGNVIISAVVIGWGDQAKPNHRFLAMDKTNGMPVWYEGTRPLPEDTTYSSPVIGVIDGELQMVCSAGDGGIHSFQPRTGKRLWSYYLSAHGINTTPLIYGNRVYCGHSEENLDSTEMGAIVCIDPTQRGDITKTGAIWKKTEYSVGRSSPQIIDGRLYFVNDAAKLYCLNPENGDQIGEPVRLGTMMRANMLYADGKLYVNEVNGRGYILKPTPEGAEMLFKYRFPSGEECHGSPIAANGKVYLPTTGKIYCIGNAEHASEPTALPEVASETHTALDEKPALVQVVPVESLLRPGTRQTFHARLYNSKGQYLRNARPDELEFKLVGPGDIDAAGVYSIPATQTKHQAASLSVKFGELEGKARLRIIPDLNWSFDFNDGVVPVTWVGCAYRHIVLDWELLEKLREADPVAGDLYIYFMTEFVNFGPKRDFDDSTPQQRWKNFLLFFNLAEGEEKPKTIEAAKAKFDASLQKLVDEHVLASFEWSNWDRKTGRGDETVPEPKLSIVQGDRKVDGNGVLCKLTTIPKGTRSQGWMGQPDLHDYTIQADVLSYSRQGKLPDAGLIGQRYTLDLMGASQQLQLRTWTPQLNRFSAESALEWKPNVWYTLKLKAENKDGKAVLSGKIWPRGETEPEQWTITAEDLAPNTIGSPGLFGNTKDGEFFYDNLTVIRNTQE